MVAFKVLKDLFFFIYFCFTERLESHFMSKQMCPKKEGALASNEFISKYKIKADQNSRIRGDECERLEEQMEATNLSN